MISKTCKNLPCSKPFETANKTKVFCCHQCAKNAWQRNHKNSSPEARLANRVAAEAWNKTHPEEHKAAVARHTAKVYRSGKKLPPWMFS